MQISLGLFEHHKNHPHVRSFSLGHQQFPATLSGSRDNSESHEVRIVKIKMQMINGDGTGQFERFASCDYSER